MSVASDNREPELTQPPPSTMRDLKNVVLYGRYYYPAYRHYNPGTTVQCDHCFRINLSSCLGYLEHDLCMPCAEKIMSSMSVPPPFIRNYPLNMTFPNLNFNRT